jgi:uncharacterized protein YqeY|tara:strand:- start:4033 stop:4473 length:441 start_codon:yes stop_codon:yes gene_type:complete
MSLKTEFSEETKRAMRERNVARRDLMRFILAAVKNLEIELQREANDEEILQLLGKQAQQRKDSIESFQAGGREDLVAKEEAELAIISEYLPEQMSENEIRVLVEAVILEVGASGPQDMGKVMGKIMPQVKGRADGRLINQMVRDSL